MVRMGGRKILKTVCPDGVHCDNSWQLEAINCFQKELNLRCYRVPSSAFAVSTSIRSYDNQFRSNLKLKCILKLKWDPCLIW